MIDQYMTVIWWVLLALIVIAYVVARIVIDIRYDKAQLFEIKLFSDIYRPLDILNAPAEGQKVIIIRKRTGDGAILYTVLPFKISMSVIWLEYKIKFGWI